MIGTVLLLSLMTTAGPVTGDCLVAIEADYREISGQSWLEQVDVLSVGRDHLIVKVAEGAIDQLPACTVLDRGDIDANVYLSVELRDATGRATAERLGIVLFERRGRLLVKQQGEVPADFRMDGLHAVVPLRWLEQLPHAAPSRPLPPSVFQPAFPDLVGDIVGAIDETQYQARIQTLENFVSRSARGATFPDACAYAHDVFESYGIDAEIEEFLADAWFGPPFTCWNVIAEKPGTTHPDQVYIICGHLDSTAGNPGQAESVAPGADDNGSGSAAVLEAARVMSATAFKYTIRFICFGAEEQGLCGSFAYADAAAAAGEDILGVINVDMLLFGPQDHDVLRIRYDDRSEPLAQAFATATTAYVPDLDLQLEYAPDAAYSDHWPFWVNGYAAVEGIEQYLSGNPYYHRTTDLLANYMVYFPFGTRCVQGAIATLATLAEPEATSGLDDQITTVAGVPALAIHEISPNPAHDLARVVFTSASDGMVHLKLFDVHGRVWQRRAIGVERERAMGIDLEVSDLPNGVYLMTATRGAGAAARKIVIAR